ncbi:hypothetical protein INT47_008278 [Mucor saturninus]|uniref:Uncharacterized protein n=1 Tax=Mucor saturninus TaxID=64648 RepID=A0A8H7V441_9FUNG|nr:hypothetical protein INT47_008278 [Mucor saturninus]
MFILNIPAEIRNLIIQKSENYLQSALVCKEWTEHALECLYKNLVLDGYDIGVIKRLLRLNEEEREAYFKNCSLVKKIKIHQDCLRRTHVTQLEGGSRSLPNKFDMPELILFLQYFQKLTTLDLTYSRYCREYFRFICDADTSNCLKGIQAIIGNPNCFNFSMCYKFRETITVLSIRYQDWTNEKLGQPLTVLAQFKNLTELKMHNTSDPFLTPLDIHAVLPHLISFHFNSRYDISDLKVKKWLQNTTNYSQFDNLKNFSLKAPTIPLCYIQFISDHLSKQVKTININISGIDFFNWIDNVGMNNALSFTKSFCGLKESGFKIGLDYKHSARNREQLNNRSNLDNFYKLLGGFKGGRNTPCCIDFGESLLSYDSMYCRKDGVIISKCRLKLDDYCLQEESIRGHLPSISMGNMSSSTVGPVLLNRIRSYMPDHNSEYISRFAKYALSNCPQLENLVLTFDYLTHSSLKISNTVYTNQFKSQSHVLSSTKSNLTHVRTSNFIISDHLMCLLSMYLPDIKQFVYCANSNYAESHMQDIQLDFTAFKNLEKIYFNDVYLTGGETDYLFVQLTYGTYENYYYKTKENPTALKPATLKLLQECQSYETLNTRLLRIKYNKNAGLVLYCGDYGAYADFVNGELVDSIIVNTDMVACFL